MNNNEVTRQILGIVGMSYKNDYSASVEYKRGNVVVYDGSSYVAKTTTTGNLPTNTTYFQLIARKPIKGEDYFTQEDIDAMVSQITQDAESEFNRNVTEKTGEFNQNATDKTDTFNSNATSKTGTFNDNATSKTTEFNTNATNKTTAFNSNATDKTTSFDGNASDKTTAFNNNATSKTGDFDSNASSKTTAYNENHTSKLAEYNQNASDKLTTYNNNHTAKLSAYNENAEEKVDEFDEHVDEIEERIEVLETVVDGLPHTTETGTDVSLKNTIEGPVKSKLDPSELEQETTTGKQLFDKTYTKYNISNTTLTELETGIRATATSSNQYKYGGVALRNSSNLLGKTLTLSASITPSGNNNGIIRLFQLSSNNQIVGTEIITISSLTSSASGTLPENFSEGAEKFALVFYSNASGTAQIGDYVDYTNVLLRLSSITDDTYEPYTNGASPNPDYPQEVKRICGDNTIIEHNSNWFNYKVSPTINNGNVQITMINNGVRLGNTTLQYRYLIYVIKSLEGLSNKTIRLKGNVNVSGTTRTCNYALGICDRNGNNRTQKISGNNVEINFTVSAEEANSGKYFYVALFLTTGVTIVSTDYTDFTNMMLTIDNDNIEYVPYQEKDYPLNLGVKNLFDFNNATYQAANQATITKQTKGYKVEAGDSSYGYCGITSTNFTLKANATYTVSCVIKSTTSSNGSRIGILSSFNTTGSVLYSEYVKTGMCYVTFTTPNEIPTTGNLFGLYVGSSNAETIFEDIQLEEGSKAHSYSEYGVEPVEYCEIGDYSDEFFYNSSKREDYIDTLEDGKWYLKKNVGKVVLNGSEDWGVSNTGTDNWYYRLSNYFYGLVDIVRKGICNYYPCVDISSVNTNKGISASAMYHFILIRYGIEDTVENFKQWLSTHNVTVYYVLDTPQYILLNNTIQKQLTDIAKTLSYDGETNISQENEELSFQISASALRDINSMFESLETRIAELETA